MDLSFTRFNAKLLVIYDDSASKILDDDYSRLVRSFRYYLGEKNSDRWVDIPVGFLTDGASVPRFLWSLIPPWGSYGQAAVLHDWLCENPYHLYQSKRIAMNRAEVDAVLYEALEVLQVNSVVRKAIKVGVDLNRFVSRGKTDPTDPRKIALQNDPEVIASFLKDLTTQ